MKNLVLYFAFFVGISFAIQAQSVIRGPYMQSPNHNSIKIMWRTDSNTDTKVWYGTDPNNLTFTATVNNNVKDHIIKITGLQPYTKYYYAVGDASGILGGNTLDHSFTTHPLPGSYVPIRIWATGDFGKGNQAQIETKQAFENYTGSRLADVWLWLGDNAYDDGKDQQYQDKVFGLSGFSDIFSKLPFYPSPGNHDYNEVWRASTTLGIPYTNIPLTNHQGPYYDIVEVPKYAETGGYPSSLEVFYSFDYGNVHFLSLNSEVFDYTTTYDGINQMIQWIKNDLQQNTKDFTIAYFHQPPYTKGSHDSDDIYELVMKAMREKVLPVLESFDIDLVVCGHSHVFERSYMIKNHYGNSSSFNLSQHATGINANTDGNFNNGTPYIKDNDNTNKEGAIHVVCGNSGSSTSSPSLDYPAMVYSHGAGGIPGAGSFIMDVYKNRLDGKYLKADGTIADEFTLLKRNIVINTMPNETICEGQSIQKTIPFTGGSDHLHYQISPTPASQNGASFVVAPTSTTTYTITISDSLTGQVISKPFLVHVAPMPTPTITRSNDTLYTQFGFNYQWYINNTPIAGAINYYYVPVVNGNYKVKITNANCDSESDFYQVSNLSINENASDFNVYPNPVVNALNVSFPNHFSKNQASYRIIDLNGKTILTGKIEQNGSIQVAELSTGSYILELNVEKHQQVIPFLKK